MSVPRTGFELATPLFGRPSLSRKSWRAAQKHGILASKRHRQSSNCFLSVPGPDLPTRPRNPQAQCPFVAADNGRRTAALTSSACQDREMERVAKQSICLTVDRIHKNAHINVASFWVPFRDPDTNFRNKYLLKHKGTQTNFKDASRVLSGLTSADTKTQNH
ncbi:hypothetical protein L798_02728 [Zootermopsis nevadensis]|uniref:Uncharacterized protein n=1 Tax=Zootermopsis nevadensis TaxID=136037 RepID=A0A067RNK9_ZOONE|nr:hypothetical protein L798_02728 [Zootermopsis nevadensis]